MAPGGLRAPLITSILKSGAGGLRAPLITSILKSGPGGLLAPLITSILKSGAGEEAAGQNYIYIYIYIYPTSPLGDRWFRGSYNQITPLPTLSTGPRSNPLGSLSGSHPHSAPHPQLHFQNIKNNYGFLCCLFFLCFVLIAPAYRRG